METSKDNCSVSLIRENEDGSADFQFNFPQKALDALTRLGILTAIQAGLDDAKRLNPEQAEEHTTNMPVAWHYPGGKPDQCTTDKTYAEMEPAWTPMYYKREWVGLTDEEIEDAIDDGFAFGLDDGNISNQAVIRYVRVIEAKLKEKNI